MVAGLDRYFQIARCFRDEDLRADRQPEFTQIDIEASFIGAGGRAAASARGWSRRCGREAGQTVELPIPRMRYADAMERYGSDKPDLRFGLEIFDATDVFRPAEFAITRSAIDAGGRVRGIRVPGGAALTRKQVDEIEAAAKSLGAAGLLRLKRTGGALEGAPAKFLGAGRRAGARPRGRRPRLSWSPGPDHVSSPALDRVRHEVADRMDLIPRGREPVRLDRGLSAVRARPGDRRARLGEPPVHRAAPGRPAPPRHRARAGAGAGLRHGAERHRAGRRQPPHRRSGAAAADLRAARHRGRTWRSSGSASCSRGSGPARRRTAASRSAWTAS